MAWIPIEDHDKQKTSAMGYPPVIGATQGGTIDESVELAVMLATKFSGAVYDARELAFTAIPGLPNWSKGEATGVHAEVLIIRAWLALILRASSGGSTSSTGVSTGPSVADALASLRGRTIVASQPACWCCAALMKQLGIKFPPEPGTKPLTGWRHPLAKKTVPNSDLPSSREGVTNSWLDEAALLS